MSQNDRLQRVFFFLEQTLKHTDYCPVLKMMGSTSLFLKDVSLFPHLQSKTFITTVCSATDEMLISYSRNTTTEKTKSISIY